MHKSATAVMIYGFMLLPWIECIMRHLGYFGVLSVVSSIALD